MISVIIEVFHFVIFKSAANINKGHTCIGQGGREVVKPGILILDRSKSRKPVAQDIHRIWGNQCILFQIRMFLRKVSHCFYSGVILCLIRRFKFFHKISGFSNVYAIRFYFSHQTVSSGFQGNPQIAKWKLIIFIGFKLFFKSAGSNLTAV